MQSLNEILEKSKKNNITVREESENWLIEHGYIYTEVFGWEKPEYLEMFNLNPNSRGIPCVQVEEIEYRENKYVKKDVYGNKTGECEIKKTPIKTGRMVYAPKENYLSYREFKKDLFEKNEKLKFARLINTPPMEYYNE